MLTSVCLATSILLLSPTAPSYVRLHAEKATASSYLQNNWNKFTENYHPNYVLDDNPKTAWVEGADGDGLGASIEIRTSPLASARTVQLKLRNGYHKSRSLLKRNAAPKLLKVVLLGQAGAKTAESTATLKRKMGWQTITVNVPKGQAFTGVRLEIVSTHPGSVFKDTCISDVQIYVDSDVPYKPKAEQAKRAAVMAWIRDRKADARYFKRLPKQYPFAATHFDVKNVFEKSSTSFDDKDGYVSLTDQWKTQKFAGPFYKLFDDEDVAALRELETVAGNKGKTWGKGPYKAVLKGQLKLPDGLDLWGLGPAIRYFDPNAISLFEGKTASRNAISDPDIIPKDLFVKYRRALPRVKWTEDKKFHRIYLWEHFVAEERSIYEVQRHLLLHFQEARLVRVYRFEDVSEGLTIGRFDFTYDDDGKIAQVESRSVMCEFEIDDGSTTYLHMLYSAKIELAKK